MRHLAKHKEAWMRKYSKSLDLHYPEMCARCQRGGNGWKHRGGTFEPHHIAGRNTLWRLLLYVPLCSECHKWVHDNPKKAKEQQWLIDPKHIQ